jgi:hypothetical protein
VRGMTPPTQEVKRMMSGAQLTRLDAQSLDRVRRSNQSYPFWVIWLPNQITQLIFRQLFLC